MIQTFEVTYGFHDRVLFENVTFSIKKNEKVGLLGRNGSGKSTLFKLIIGQEIPMMGKIIIPKNYTIGYLDQHIHFTKQTVLDETLTALANQDGTEDYLAKKILIGLGFSESDFDKPIKGFSGGYQLRIHLAKVLLKKPDLLLLDEPTNYLDILSISWLKNYLKEYPGELILITHDREFMDAVTSSIIGIHRQKVKKIEAKTQDYFEKLLQEEMQYEKTRQNIEKKKEHLEAFINRFGAKATKAKQAQSRKKQLTKIPSLEKLNAIEQLNFSFVDAPIQSQKILELVEIDFGYEPDKKIINHFSLEIAKGEKIAIIGKNGFGKSTLLKMIASIINPDHGFVKKNPHLQIGYFGQTHISQLNPDHTVLEEIKLSNPSLKEEESKGICGAMLFSSSAMEKKISMLSGGEKSRVLLGKILAKPNHLILLDEPTHHLDMESIEALIEAIDQSESAFFIVTHSEEILKRLPLDKIVYCQKDTQEIFLGDYELFLEKKPEFFSSETLKEPETKKNETKNSFFEIKRLQSEMRKIEKKIMDLEEELKKIDQKILKFSEKGETISSVELKKKKSLEEEIENLFLMLEKQDKEIFELKNR